MALETSQTSLITAINSNHFILKIRGESLDSRCKHLPPGHQPDSPLPGVNQSGGSDGAGATSGSRVPLPVLDYPSYQIGGGNVIKLARREGRGGKGRGIVRLYMWPLVSNEGDTGLDHCQVRSGLQDVSLLSSSRIITH